MKAKFLVLVIVLGLVSVPMKADSTSIFTTSQSQFDPGVDNQGWWSPSGPGPTFDANDNYFLGWTTIAHRSFFTFDISSLAGETVTSARLELTRFGSASPDPTETIGLFDVSTDATVLNNNVGTSPAIYADLGTGISYGTFEVGVSGGRFDVLVFDLNGAAVADINASAGGFFSIGASILSLSFVPQVSEFFFSGSGTLGNEANTGVQRLVVGINPVPEPGTLSLLAAGLLMGAAFRKRFK